MWLVLGQDNDVEAGWIAARLGERSDRPVRWVAASTLVRDCRWEHRVSGSSTSSRLVLGDGTVLDSTTVDAVVNRLCWLGAEGYTGASARDRAYAGSEFYALGLSWLESLAGRVLNRPAATGLAGGWRRTSEWRGLARAAGLSVVPYRSNEPDLEADETDLVALVLDGEVIRVGGPAVSTSVCSSLAKLQHAAGLDLLGVRFAAGDRLRSASSLPAMSRFGDAGIEALHRALLARDGALG
jgi:hypothetical protein